MRAETFGTGIGRAQSPFRVRLRELLDLAQFEPASGNLLPAGVFDSLSAPSR